jgi:hypothetical protein
MRAGSTAAAASADAAPPPASGLATLERLKWDNSFTRELPGDEIESNKVRQVTRMARPAALGRCAAGGARARPSPPLQQLPAPLAARGACPAWPPFLAQVHGAFYSYVSPTPTGTHPTTIISSPEVARLVGLDPSELGRAEFGQVFSGNGALPGTKPYAQCYGERALLPAGGGGPGRRHSERSTGRPGLASRLAGRQAGRQRCHRSAQPGSRKTSNCAAPAGPSHSRQMLLGSGSRCRARLAPTQRPALTFCPRHERHLPALPSPSALTTSGACPPCPHLLPSPRAAPARLCARRRAPVWDVGWAAGRRPCHLPGPGGERGGRALGAAAQGEPPLGCALEGVSQCGSEAAEGRGGGRAGQPSSQL